MVEATKNGDAFDQGVQKAKVATNALGSAGLQGLQKVNEGIAGVVDVGVDLTKGVAHAGLVVVDKTREQAGAFSEKAGGAIAGVLPLGRQLSQGGEVRGEASRTSTGTTGMSTGLSGYEPPNTSSAAFYAAGRRASDHGSFASSVSTPIELEAMEAEDYYVEGSPLDLQGSPMYFPGSLSFARVPAAGIGGGAGGGGRGAAGDADAVSSFAAAGAVARRDGEGAGGGDSGSLVGSSEGGSCSSAAAFLSPDQRLASETPLKPPTAAGYGMGLPDRLSCVLPCLGNNHSPSVYSASPRYTTGGRPAPSQLAYTPYMHAQPTQSSHGGYEEYRPFPPDDVPQMNTVWAMGYVDGHPRRRGGRRTDEEEATRT